MSGPRSDHRSGVGVLLLTFGSAVTSAEVPAYLRSVRGGSEASADLITEFRRRFDVIGRSPLIDITTAQAHRLQGLLDAQHGAHSFTVAVGMLHSAPSVADGLRVLASAAVDRAVAIVLAPQYSPLILGGYQRALREQGPSVLGNTPITVARAWHLTPSWIASLVVRLNEALLRWGDRREQTAVVFTAHSLPRQVLERDPAYLAQIHATIDAVARAAHLDPAQWTFAYQSAGHTAEEWLTPDLLDVLPVLRERGTSEVVIAPVQFVADHLEVLYDIDVAAAAQAGGAGLAFHRIGMPNDSPEFAQALAEVVDREVAAAPV